MEWSTTFYKATVNRGNIIIIVVQYLMYSIRGEAAQPWKNSSGSGAGAEWELILQQSQSMYVCMLSHVSNAIIVFYKEHAHEMGGENNILVL